ncbi:MAG: type II/IV secretion system ATPase subunit [Thaumarchaeota archaeon]|nr:type II/IV secretion system ATPase subunit [Nitrososphaerota archaeon]
MKIGGGLKLGKKEDGVQKSENELVENKLEKTTKLEPRAIELPELGQSLSSFITVTHLDYQDDYPVYTGIVTDPTAHGGKRFMVIEPTFTAKDRKNFETIRQILMVELTVDLNDIATKKLAEQRLKHKILDIIRKYKLDITKGSMKKIIYYAIRDFVYLGKIEPLMHDPMIEEISCDGTNIPLYIWHREYESMPTNVFFTTDAELDNYARKIAYVSGQHISMAQPIVDASLPGGDRINLTLGREITKKGSTFTIRRFREDPVTIIDLLKYNTMSADIAAYLWWLVEHRSTALVAGGTASGKTTTLNAISTFIPPQQKIVTIEDTQELNLPHENWIPAVARQSFSGSTMAEITQFDLLRAALRQRPDIIIVGETRGKEAYTLFQAMATGHGGFSSIHADSVAATLNRLTSAPMDIPKVLIGYTLHAIILQLKLTIGGRSVRRIIQISEIAGLDDKTGEILLNDVFNWNPSTDRHVFSGRSILFDKIADRYGINPDQVSYELNKRKTALNWMLNNDIRKYKDVSATIMEFYADPDRFYERKRMLV